MISTTCCLASRSYVTAGTSVRQQTQGEVVDLWVAATVVHRLVCPGSPDYSAKLQCFFPGVPRMEDIRV